MRKRSVLLIPTALALAALLPSRAAAQVPGRENHPGAAVYQRACESCHAGGDVRAPALTTLQAMTAADLTYALTQGRMAAQGTALSAEERAAVIEYLAAPEVQHDGWIASIMCTPDQRRVDLSGTVAMRTATVDITGSRMMSAEAAGLTKADMQNLELAWAIGFPGVTTLRASPVIVGSTIFYSAVNTGKVLALNAETGCIQWVYDSPAPLRSSISLGELTPGGRPTLFFTDGRGQVQAVDAQTGAGVWIADALVDPGNGMLTGSVVYHAGKVIVPISASGVTAGARADFECCVGRGAVVALDAATGRRLWSYVTMEEARYTGAVSPTGVRQRGPSGAPIWSTPTIDVGRNRVYVTTGENTSLPATNTSDAIIALDFDTGQELWVLQATPNDVWHMGCPNGPNCPSAESSIRRDWDFGSSAVLATLENGRQVLLAGQKSGHLWALDPDNGSVLWQQRVGGGSALGGNHWGIAIDGQRVFLPINDPLPGDVPPMPGVYTFDIATGTPVWEHRLQPDCPESRRQFAGQCQSRYGISALPIVVDGALITAGIDGRVHIFDGVDGRVLFQYDTARRFDTINGVEANGGSVDAHSIAAGAGTVLIGSGYAMFSQPRGNVLLAFRPRRE